MLSLNLPPTPGGFNPTKPRMRRPAGPGRHRIRVLCAMGSNMRIKFTKANIEALEPPPKGEIFAWCEDMPGWGVRILASGRKSWCVQYRDKSGKSKRHTLGDLRILPLSLAEQRAREILSNAKLGRDVLAEEAAARRRKEVEAERSVKRIAEAYLAEPDVKRLRSYDATAWYLRTVWAPIHGESAETIGREQLTPELRKIASERGEVTANRARSALSSMFVRAITHGWLRREGNPTTFLPKWKERSRERVLDLEEVAVLWRVAPQVNETFGRILRLLILTGCRKSEVAELRWSEVDLDDAVIRLPGSRVKGGRPVTIPLPPAAVAILEEAPRVNDTLVFVGLAGWSWAKQKLDQRILEARREVDPKAEPMPHWTIHDIRRSCRSLWIDGERGLGLDVHLCELMLGHALPGIIGTYDKATRLPERRRALERWADLVLRAAGEPAGDAKVVNLR